MMTNTQSVPLTASALLKLYDRERTTKGQRKARGIARLLKGHLDRMRVGDVLTVTSRLGLPLVVVYTYDPRSGQQYRIHCLGRTSIFHARLSSRLGSKDVAADARYGVLSFLMERGPREGGIRINHRAAAAYESWVNPSKTEILL